MAAPTSGQSAARQNGTAKGSGSGRRKHVASAAGAARYGKPIGSEIGGPRDANHAAIQSDQGARKNYGDLIGGDQAAQRQALDGMNTEDLNKLADIAYSFKSSDPKVVALRIAARNAQARRGIRVPVGQTQTSPTGGKAPPPLNRNNRGTAKALSAVGPNSARLIELAGAAEQKNTSKLGNFPIPDTTHLRKAISAIGRAKPEHRPIIARHILARAKALKAEHMVGDHIKHYALGHRKPGSIGMSRSEQAAVELAGRWKHGYIPLDAEAVASKMKGGKGKPWWIGPGHSSGGAGKALHGSPKAGSPGSSGKLTNVVKSGPAESKPRGAAVNNDMHAKKEAAIAARIASGKGKTTQGVLHPDHKVQIEKLQAAGKHEEAGAIAKKSLADSKARIAALVQKAKSGGPTHADHVRKAKAAGMSHADAKKYADSRVKTDAIAAKRSSDTQTAVQGPGATTSTTDHGTKLGKARKSEAVRQDRTSQHFKDMGAGAGQGKSTASASTGDFPSQPSHPNLYHTTRESSVASIRKSGFHGQSRTNLEGGAGSYFGVGTYLHTDKSHADAYTSGMRSFGHGDETNIEARAHLDKPFVVKATASDTSPGGLMLQSLVRAGLARPGEKLDSAEITRRLKAAGYDGVEVKQSGGAINHHIAGSQLVVFDSKKVQPK